MLRVRPGHAGACCSRKRREPSAARMARPAVGHRHVRGPPTSGVRVVAALRRERARALPRAASHQARRHDRRFSKPSGSTIRSPWAWSPSITGTVDLAVQVVEDVESESGRAVRQETCDHLREVRSGRCRRAYWARGEPVRPAGRVEGMVEFGGHAQPVATAGAVALHRAVHRHEQPRRRVPLLRWQVGRAAVRSRGCRDRAPGSGSAARPARCRPPSRGVRPAQRRTSTLNSRLIRSAVGSSITQDGTRVPCQACTLQPSG